MNNKNTNKYQLLRLLSVIAAWESILPFLQVYPNVYVGDAQDCRRFLSALVWIAKEESTRKLLCI